MKIQLKRSNVLDSGAAKQPTASQLEYGELAVNYNTADPAIFLKDSNNNVIRISGVGNISDDGLTNVPDGTTPPSNPESGNLWYNSDQGRLYIYFEDADTSQWVDASPDSWDPTVLPDTSNAAQQSGTLDDRYVVKGANSGNIGLGVNSPISTLDVIGTTTSRLSDSTKGVQITNDGAVEIWRTGGNPFIDFKSSSTEDYDCRIQQQSDGLAISTGGNGNSPERLRINSSGQMIIGGTSPLDSDKQLTLTTTSTSGGLGILSPNNGRGDIFFGDAADNNVGQIKYSHVNDSLTIRTNAADRFTIDSSGNVGIGTTSPTRPLHLQASDCRIRLTDSDAPSVSVELQNISGDGVLTTNGSSILKFSPNNLERMRIDSLGNIKQSVASGANNGFTVNNGTNDLFAFGTGGFAVNGGTATDGGIRAYNNLVFGTGSSSSEKMRIDSSGNVGIGTTNPLGNKLFIDGGDVRIDGAASTNATLQIRGDNSTGSATDAVLSFVSYLSNVSAGSNADITVTNQGSGYGQMVFSTRRGSGANTEAMRIDSSGRIGIGTSSPDNLLDVRGSSNPQLKVSATNTGTNSAGLYIENQGQRNWQIWADRASDQLRIGNNGRAATNIAITDTRVGIGTTNPTARLHIVGNLSHEGDVVIKPENTGGEGGQITLYNPDKTSVGATIDISTANAFRIFQLNNNSVMELGQLGGTGGIVKFVTAGSERVRIDSSGRLLVGTSSGSVLRYGSNIAKIETNSNDYHLAMRNDQNTQYGQYVTFVRSRSNGAVQSGDDLGSYQWQAHDGTNVECIAASITAFVDGTPGSNDMPGRLVFSTTADGASSPTERMRIDNLARITLGSQTNPSFVTEPPVTNYFTSATPTTNDNGLTGSWAANASIAPDGTKSASKFTATSTPAFSRFSQVSSSVNLNSTAYTLSFYAKSESGSSQTHTVDLGDDVAGSYTITTSWQRFVFTSLVPINGRFIDFGSVDGNWSLWGVQIQTENAATSYVKPSGGVATTSAARATVGTRYSDYSDLLVAGNAEVDGSVYFAGNLGIGTSSPGSKLHIQDTMQATANGHNQITITGDDSGTVGESARIYLSAINATNRGCGILSERTSSSNAHALIFQTSSDSAVPAERMRITSTGQMRLAGAGITFNGDTATANQLDDYEEGIWTPSYYNSSGNAISHTLTVVKGKYTKIGRQVFLQLKLYGSISGLRVIRGLPFAVANDEFAGSASGGIAGPGNALVSTSAIGMGINAASGPAAPYIYTNSNINLSSQNLFLSGMYYV